MIHGFGRRRDAAQIDRHTTPKPKGRPARRAIAATAVVATAAVVALWPTAATLDTAGRDGPVASRPDVAAAPAATARRLQQAMTVVPIPPLDARRTDAAMPKPVLLMPGTNRPALDIDAKRTARGPVAPQAGKKTTERERAMARELAALRQQLDAERAKLAALYRGKAPMLRTLDQQSRQGVAHAEKVIAMTGLDIDKLLASHKIHAAHAAKRAVHPDGTEAFDATANALSQRVERWRKLQIVLKRLPLIAPLDHYRKTSNFGKRKHPITGRVTNHNGTDFAYYRGAPVRATAAGKVVFAGRRGGFGNLVEVDHGQGIRTRYAHLHKPLVKKGDTVVFRQQIGQLGSTGRSTGPHVHYEILVRGRAVEPMKFVTAGKYAFKPVPKEELVAVKPEDEKRDGEAFRTASAKAKVDMKPTPRAAASMIDRPDSATWPGIVAHPGATVALGKVTAPPAPAVADPADLDLSKSRIFAAGIVPSLRPRKRLHRKSHRRHHRRRHRRAR